MAQGFYARYIPPSRTTQASSTPKAAIPKVEEKGTKRTRGDDQERTDKSKRKRRKTREESHRELVSQEVWQNNPNLIPIIPRKSDALDDASLSKQVAVHENTVEKKRRRENNKQDEAQGVPMEVLSGEKNDHLVPELDLEQEMPLRQKNRKKTKKTSSNESSVTLEADDPRDISEPQEDENKNGEKTKHKRIRAKFENSAKISTKLKNKATESQIGRAEDEVENEDSKELHGLEPLPQPEEIPDTGPPINISTLPEWIAKPIIASDQLTVPFGDMDIDASMISALEQAGHEKAFAIQAAVIPLLLPANGQYNGDLCISAATGSGKTLAYAVPMIENLKNKPVRQLRGLIVVPTRELVAQARVTLEICSAKMGLQIGTAFGSKSLAEEQQAMMEKTHRYDPIVFEENRRKRSTMTLNDLIWDELDDAYDNYDSDDEYIDFVRDHASKVDILICTPGRLVEHMKSTEGFTLDHVEWLVIDEADKLLDQSFQQWLDTVLPALKTLPKSNHLEHLVETRFHIPSIRRIRKIILSATMTKDLSKLIGLDLYEPALVALESENLLSKGETNDAMVPRASEQATAFNLPSKLTELALPVSNAAEKPLYLLHLLQQDLAGLRPLGGQSNIDWTSSDDSSSSSDSESDLSDIDSRTSSSSSFRDSSNSPDKMSNRTHGALVFTLDNESALRLHRLLTLLRPSIARSFAVVTNSTNNSRTISGIRNGTISVVIASDRLSRGLDIPNLACVVNYDMPTSLTNYIHRVGRTARAGNKGSAYTFVEWRQGKWFWNSIGGSTAVKRVDRIRRGEDLGTKITPEEKEEYLDALEKLKEEARSQK